MFPDSKSWLHEYRRRLALCSRRPIKYTSSINNLNPPHQLANGELRDIDVILAIGALWLGLIHDNVDFAYANSDVFSIARSMRMVGMRAVKGSNHFLMPLLFNDELQALSPESEEDIAEPLEPVFSAFQQGEAEKNQEQIAAAEEAKQKDPGNKNKLSLPLKDQEIQNQNYKGGIGHFMLAIAEKIDRSPRDIVEESTLTKKTIVRLRFMDSSVGHTEKEMIRRVARNIVRHSGWLDDIWPYFDANEEYWPEVIEQSKNRCGEHTVLNAWAYMLGITPAATRERSLGYSSYNDIRKMISLALRGQLDSLTIRAWMRHSKYAVDDEPLSRLQEDQIQKPDSPNKFCNTKTVAVNEYAFNDMVNGIHMQEQATKQSFAIQWGAMQPSQDSSTTQASGHATEVANGVMVPPSGQGPVAGPSGTSGISGSSTGVAQTPSLLQASFSRPTSWQQSLTQGLGYHDALKANNPRFTTDTRKTATTINRSSELADYEVVLGIAPIWEGLKRLQRVDINFTFAGMDVFSPGGEQEGYGAVGGWSRFIMPLFLSPIDDEALAKHQLANQEKGRNKFQGVGHLLLCVAELVNSQAMTVQVEILDSCVDPANLQRIKQIIPTMIERSGWLAGGSGIQPVYRYNEKPVPRQVGGNTCGLYVILNAWATMLGVPIHPYWQRRRRFEHYEGNDTDDAFLATGLRIVNLALQGFMDSATIQAFFNVFGYSVEQRFGDPTRSVVAVNAVGMNHEKLRLTLTKRYRDHNLGLVRAENFRFPDADMAFLREQGGMTEDQAVTALVMAKGSAMKALGWHHGQDVAGELPRPEDALSPKTPDRRRMLVW